MPDAVVGLIGDEPTQAAEVIRSRRGRLERSDARRSGFFLEAALHIPAHDNDRRNFHLHINYHERAGVYDETAGK